MTQACGVDFETSRQADIQTIADRLDVGTVVNGSVRRAGDRINVVVQWIQVDNERQLWSARYQRTLDDVFDVQQEIAVGIAEAIRKELDNHDTVAAMSRQRYQTTDVRAWELFRRGLALVLTTLPGPIAKGRALLQEALLRDPDYIAARAALAWSDIDDPQARVEGARDVLALEPANLLASWVLIEDSLTFWDFATAAHLVEQALAAHPHAGMPLTAVAHHVYAGTGALQFRPD
jgi:hypothetical protein